MNCVTNASMGLDEMFFGNATCGLVQNLLKSWLRLLTTRKNGFLASDFKLSVHVGVRVHRVTAQEPILVFGVDERLD